jgi:hypothetical protein
MEVRKPNYPLGFVVLLTALAFLVYSAVPAFFLRFNSHQSPGTINALNDHSLSYQYRNAFDGQTYTVSRYISVPAYHALRNKRQLTVWYPRYFPEEAQVVEVDLPPVLLPSVLAILLVLVGLWQIVKRLRTRETKPMA